MSFGTVFLQLEGRYQSQPTGSTAEISAENTKISVVENSIEKIP
ncbi:unnamed protein product [Haemonchus placei]|uniref:Spore germination protein n=1 Tax=Haemonchus placei TaxID=6290 RepID=A0A0N4VWH8_HAEPC|nr:unnamed protein product [Haemonchus placei]